MSRTRLARARTDFPPFALAAVIILLAALARLLPHPPNFTPIEAMALFGGAMLSRRSWAIAITLGAMLLSDLILGLHALQPLVYACLLVGVLIGGWIGPAARAGRVAGGALASGLLFWVVTNFAVWATSGMYPLDGAGLALCFELALPFLRNSLAALALYSLILFGAVHLYRRWFGRGLLSQA
jgi:hypothetical protein